jgi:hypothetical protein
MKKLGALSLVLLIVTGALAADDGLAITGHFYTGLVLEKEGSGDLFTYLERDGGIPARARLNFEFAKDNWAIKWRLQAAAQNGNNLITEDILPYAFGTGMFLNGQIGVSLGRIDGALWNSGGNLDNSYDAVSGARFEFKPAVVEGLSLGFSLPAVWDSIKTSDEYKFKAADYFSELIFGARYNLTDTLDVRLAVKLDGDGDDTAATEEGTGLIWGLGLPVTGTFVPGLSIWIDGQVTGIGVEDKLGTISAFKAGYASEGLDTYAVLKLETFAKGAGKKTGFYVIPGASYQVTPLLKPGLEVGAYLYGYEDNIQYGGEDAKAFDKIYFYPYVDLSVGAGFTIRPCYTLTFNGANGPSGNSADSRIDHKFEIRFQYEF